MQPDKNQSTEEIPEYVTSASQLADLLGVHRNTIATWKKDPSAPAHAPKGYKVGDWTTWASEIASRADVPKSSKKAEREYEKLCESVRRLKLDNDEKERMLVPISEVKESIYKMVSELNGIIRTIEDGLPMALQGLGLPEQRVEIRKQFDDMRAKINKGEEGIIK